MPVPEVYGWCRDQGETFSHMQLVDGITLEDAWPDMVVEEKYDLYPAAQYFGESCDN